MLDFRHRWNWRQFNVAVLAVLVATGAGLAAQNWRAAAGVSAAKADAVALNKATKNLAYALSSNNEGLVKRLTTARGFAALQHAKADKQFGAYPKLSERLIKEWASKSNYCSYLNREEEEGSSACSYSTTAADRFSMEHLHRGQPDGEIAFTRGESGWNIDDYKPSQWFYHSSSIALSPASLGNQAGANVSAMTAP